MVTFQLVKDVPAGSELLYNYGGDTVAQQNRPQGKWVEGARGKHSEWVPPVAPQAVVAHGGLPGSSESPIFR